MGLRLTFLFCATVSPMFASVGLAIVGAVLRPPRNNSFARRREKKSKDLETRVIKIVEAAGSCDDVHTLSTATQPPHAVCQSKMVLHLQIRSMPLGHEQAIQYISRERQINRRPTIIDKHNGGLLPSE